MAMMMAAAVVVVTTVLAADLITMMLGMSLRMRGGSSMTATTVQMATMFSMAWPARSQFFS